MTLHGVTGVGWALAGGVKSKKVAAKRRSVGIGEIVRRTSAAEAACFHGDFCGTAEAVPLSKAVRASLERSHPCDETA